MCSTSLALYRVPCRCSSTSALKCIIHKAAMCSRILSSVIVLSAATLWTNQAFFSVVVLWMANHYQIKLSFIRAGP